MLVGEQDIVILSIASEELLLQESSMNERRKEKYFQEFHVICNLGGSHQHLFIGAAPV